MKIRNKIQTYLTETRVDTQSIYIVPYNYMKGFVEKQLFKRAITTNT